VAVAAHGPVAWMLARRLLARSDEELAQLQGVAGTQFLLVTGDGEALPWADGAVYLGRDAGAPSMLVPTTQEPSIPLPLLESALLANCNNLTPPIAVLPSHKMIASLTAARPLARDTLRGWIKSNFTEEGVRKEVN